jgi:hypothetical protein
LYPHPGPDWTYNHPTSTDFVRFPIIHPSGNTLDATYVKYDLVPNPPQLLGSHGAGQPIHSQVLHPKRATHFIDSYTEQQKRLFDPKEPTTDWVIEACDVEGDKTLIAGVTHYMYLKRMTDATSAQIRNLMLQLSCDTSAALEALRDLENADAYRCLTAQIDWLDKSDNYHSQAAKAYRDITAQDPAWGAPSPSSYPIPHTRRRCYHCRKLGHIVRDCPTMRKPKMVNKPQKRKGKGKKAVYWKDL